MDHMKEAIKRHMGKAKHPAERDEDEKGSQKGPGETDHAPTIGQSPVQELANPTALQAPSPMMGSPMPGQDPAMMLGPEHLEALKALMSHGGVGLDAKAAASAKEKFASIQKHKAK